MAEYSVFTMCSKNYRDAYDFVIGSWLKAGIKKIYVYTDDSTWKSNNDRVEMIPFFVPTDDWLVNTGRRVIAARDVVKRDDYRMVFLDIDCYLVKDIGHIFDDYDFDFAVTRLYNLKTAVSAGAYFFYNTERNRVFFDEWLCHQKINYKKGRGVTKYCGSYAQFAFSDVLRRYDKSKSHKVIDLDVDMYNRKTGKKSLVDWTIEGLKKDSIEVLHFYARTWRTEEAKKIISYINSKE